MRLVLSEALRFFGPVGVRPCMCARKSDLETIASASRPSVSLVPHFIGQ